MEPNQTTPPVLETKPNHKLFYILLALAVLFIGTTGFLYFQNRDVKIEGSVVSLDLNEQEVVSEVQKNWQEIKVATVLKAESGRDLDESVDVEKNYNEIQKNGGYEGGGASTGAEGIQFIGNDSLIVQVPYQDGVYFAVFKYGNKKFKLLDVVGSGNYLTPSVWNSLVSKYGKQDHSISTYSKTEFKKDNENPTGNFVYYDTLTKVGTNVFIENYWVKADGGEAASAPDTSNWKTYRNEEYGFEFKYPENWEKFFGDSVREVSFGTKNKPDDYPFSLGLYIEESFDNLKIRYGLKETDFVTYTKSQGYPSFDKKINGIDWICIDHSGDGPGDIIGCDFETSNKNLIFMNFSMASVAEAEMDKILSTFKFTK